MSTATNLKNDSGNYSEQELNLSLQGLGINLSKSSLHKVYISSDTLETGINYYFENFANLVSSIENNDPRDEIIKDDFHSDNSGVDDVVVSELADLTECDVDFLADNIPSILSILSQNKADESVTIICLDSLLNLTNDTKYEENRIVLIKEANFLSNILEAISHPSIPYTVKSKYLRLLWYLSRSESCAQYPTTELIIKQVIPILNDRNITEDAALCSVAVLANLSLHMDNYRNIIAKSGAIPILLQLLRQDNNSIQDLVLAAFKNLSTNATICSTLMYSGILESLYQVMRAGTETSDVSKERAVTILLNIVTNSEPQKLVLFEDCIPAIVELLVNGSLKSIRDALVIISHFVQVDDMMTYISTNKELLHTVCSVFKDSVDIEPILLEALRLIIGLCAHETCKKVLISQGVFPTLLLLLDDNAVTTTDGNADPTTVDVDNNILLEQVLEAVLNLLTHGSLFDYIPLHSSAAFPKLLQLLISGSISVRVKVRVLTIVSHTCNGIRSSPNIQHEIDILPELLNFSQGLVDVLFHATQTQTQVDAETAANKLLVESALTAMVALTAHPPSLSRLREAGGILLLIRLLSSSNLNYDYRKQFVVNVLYNFCIDATCRVMIADEDRTISCLVELLASAAAARVTKEFVCAILFQLSNEERYAVAIMDASAVPQLVDLLSTGSPYLKTYSAGILSGLAAVRDEYRLCIGQSGAIPLLVELHTSSTDDDGKKYSAAAIWELSFLASNRPALVDARARSALLASFCDGAIANSSLKSKVAGALANLMTVSSDGSSDNNSRSSSNNINVMDTSNFLPSLLKMLRNEDRDDTCTQNAVLLVMHLTENESYVKKLMEGGIVKPLVHILGVSTGTTKVTTIIALGNLAAIHDSYRQSIAAAGALPLLSHALLRGNSGSSGNRGIGNANIIIEKEEVVLTIRNLSLDPSTASLLADCQVIQYMMLLLVQYQKMTTKTTERATMSLLQMATHSPSHRMDFVKANDGTRLLVNLLSSTSAASPDSRANIVAILLLLAKESELFRLVVTAVSPAASVTILIQQLAEGTPSAKLQVMELLTLLSTDSAAQGLLRTSGIVTSLCRTILRGSDESMKELCYGALLLFISDEESENTVGVVVQLGTMTSIVASLSKGSSACKVRAAQILGAVIMSDVSWVEHERYLFGSLASLLCSSNVEEKENAVAALRGLSHTPRFCDQIVSSRSIGIGSRKSDVDALQSLGSLLISNSAICKEDSLVILAQITRSSTDNRNIVANRQDIISGLIHLIRESGDEEPLKDSSVDILFALSEVPAARVKIVNAGASISLLCDVMGAQSTTEPMLERCLGTLVNLTADSDPCKRCLAAYCPLLTRLLTGHSQTVSERAVVLLYYLAGVGDSYLRGVVSAESLVPNLILLLRQGIGSDVAVLADLKLLFRITSGGTKAVMIFLVSDNTVSTLTALLTSANASIRGELLGVICNLSIKQENRSKFIDANIVAPVAAILTAGEARAQHYAILVLTDICKGKEQRHDNNRLAVVGTGALSFLVNRLLLGHIEDEKMRELVKDFFCVLARNTTVRSEMKRLGITKDSIGYTKLFW